MNQSIRKFFALAALLSVAPAFAATSFYTFRSQSVNAAREMVGWEADIDRCGMDHVYGSMNATLEWSQTFHGNNIAQCLFGPSLVCTDCDSSIIIQGSQVADRNAKAWLADYFGLPTDFDGTVSFKPRISNFMADLNFYIGLDELADGLYFRIHAPITYTRWKLNPSESITAKGTNDDPVGYFAPSAVTNANLLSSALDFFNGTKAPTLPNDVIFNKLAYGKWASDCDCSSLTKTRLSDIEFELGWNFWCNDDYLIGVGIRASAPTGNKPDGSYLFEPIVGSGGFWKLGGSLDFHAIFWRNEEETSSFGFYLDANIQHLFDTCQKRTFDLCSSGTLGKENLENSRYMLAQKLADNTDVAANNKLLQGSYQFANEFAPVANLTAFNVDVSVSVEADIAAMFAYTNGNFNWDLGYEFYGRSCENICPKSSCGANPLDGKTWALKGDSQVVGFSVDGETVYTVNLAATQSLATIYSGVNNFAVGTTAANRANSLHIDNPVFATSANGAVNTTSTSGNQTRTSNSAIFLSQANVNFGGTRAITNKIFTHLNYAWRDNEDWTPYLGIGAEVEFGSGCNSCNDACDTSCNTTTTTSCNTSCNTSCDTCSTCVKCVPSQWGVWLKGGVSFN